nr:hypothetical protein GCM10010200_056580 [Actinomadura rugatobispora]
MLVGLGILAAAIAAFGLGGPVLRILSMPLRRPGWNVWVGTFNGVVLITVLALPLAALAVWALARRRSAAGVAQAWRMSLAEVGIVYGTVPWVWMILLPGDEAGAVVSLVPLRDLLTMDTFQIVGNLLVFAALGFLAPPAVRGAGVGTADPGARGGLLGPGRDRPVRPAAGPGVLGGRRSDQRRRCRAGRPGIAPLVARHGHRVVGPTSAGPGTWPLSRPRYAGQQPRGAQPDGLGIGVPRERVPSHHVTITVAVRDRHESVEPGPSAGHDRAGRSIERRSVGCGAARRRFECEFCVQAVAWSTAVP